MFVMLFGLVWLVFFFFFNDTATTEIYTLSLHDALPISGGRPGRLRIEGVGCATRQQRHPRPPRDRKSTRLNSSHLVISYAVFCLKKKKKKKILISSKKKKKKKKKIKKEKKKK